MESIPPIPWRARLPFPLRDTIRRWRSLLGMVLGVGIALGLALTNLAVSNASVELFSADYRRSGADLYVITQGGKLIAILPGDTPGTIKDARGVLSGIRRLPGVKAAVGFITWGVERQKEGPRRRDEPAELVMAVGVDGDPTAIPDALVVEQGRWIRRSNEAFLGSKLAREKALRLGDRLRLSGREFSVVGTGKLRGAGFSADSLAYLDRQALRQRSDLGDVVNAIIIDTERPEAVRRDIAARGSYAVFSPEDLARQAEEVNQTALVIRWVFIALVLTIAGLFVSSMLLRSVGERRIEFATMRAIGVPTHTILATVVAQALSITTAAWVVGLLVSVALGWLFNTYVAPQYGIETLYVPDARLFSLVLGLAIGLGAVAGFVPARRATLVDPVLVLREV